MATLPLPISEPAGSKKKATFEKTNLHVHWARFKKRIGASAPSESFLDGEGGDGTDASSTWKRLSDRPNQHKPAAWLQTGGQEYDQLEELDEIVVDNVFLDISNRATSASNMSDKAEGAGSMSHPHTDKESFTQQTHTDNPWDNSLILSMLRWRLYPILERFVSLRFMDDSVETHYSREVWFTSKPPAMWGGLWLCVNWALGCALVARPLYLMDKIFYFGIGPVLCFPVPIMIVFDFPRNRPKLYQSFLMLSIWSWSIYNVLYIYLCGKYGSHAYWNCGTRDFLGLLYYGTALPCIALFALQQTRIPALVGATGFIALMLGLIVPLKHTFIRNVINVFVFHLFLLYIQYTRELSERRLYKLRDQVKLQYRATQKAQVSERKAADSKRRLTSYVFHEVRVPLNTAMLALQNLEATSKKDKEESIELSALSGSLSMMSKVLSDILDFNRMDAGRFESVSKPYSFHRAIRSMTVGLKLAGDAKGVQVITQLDKNIDLVARTATYQAMGKSPEWIAWQLATNPDEDGLVVGDEMRMIQVISNLTSNACKFTPGGPNGKVIVRTKLLIPATVDNTNLSGSTTVDRDFDETPKGELRSSVDKDDIGLSEIRISRHNSYNITQSPPPAVSLPPLLENVVIRIEVQDTGVGIRPRDMIDNKLFSPYVQTEIGRHQGGKGTGLGLALVRHIVKLSGGRLGVKSKRDMGSMFWVELPLGVGKRTLMTPGSGETGRKDGFYGFVDGNLSHPSLVGQTDQTPSTDKSEDYLGNRRPSTSTNPMDSPDGMVRMMADDQAPVSTFRSHTLNVISPTPQDTPPVNGASLSRRRDTFAELPDFNSLSSSPVSIQASENPFQAHRLSNGSTSPTRPPQAALSGRSRPRPSFVRMPSSPPFIPFADMSSEPVQPVTTSSDDQQPSPSVGSLCQLEATLRVLVVDDDLLTRRLMERMLKRLGCTVELAENGQIALEKILEPPSTPAISTAGTQDPLSDPPAFHYVLDEGRFTIVFLDNQMPILSGVEMTKQLRLRGRKDFLVGVTGNALKEDQIEYLEAGVDRVLTKPVLERSLKEMLKLALDRRRGMYIPPAVT